MPGYVHSLATLEIKVYYDEIPSILPEGEVTVFERGIVSGIDLTAKEITVFERGIVEAIDLTVKEITVFKRGIFEEIDLHN